MTKSALWGWLVAGVAFTGVVLVLAFVLALTGEAPAFYERQFVWLFWLNIAVAAVLALVVLLAAVRLAVRKRQGKFGTLLLIRLAGIFALVGVLPGALIYTVSYQFVSRSIEVWFDARVQGALDAGLDLGRGTLEALVADLGNKTRVAADRLGESRGMAAPLALERLREQLAAQDVALVGPTGQILVTASGSASSIVPERPSAALQAWKTSRRATSPKSPARAESAKTSSAVSTHAPCRYTIRTLAPRSLSSGPRSAIRTITSRVTKKSRRGDLSFCMYVILP